MDLELLERTLSLAGEPAFRARQVWRWAAQGAGSYQEMTNLPRGLRDELAGEVPFSSLTVEHESHSQDGTVKALFRTGDGWPVEAVLMVYRDGRRSICISSQSGCPLTCSFCATGQMRFARNLTASEILDQALHFRRLGQVDHAVFMGMGEPMMNLDGVLGACTKLPDVGVTHRRTAISTVGWIPGIERLTEERMPVRLALSLHAADPALRSELMPVNDRYPLADVLAACRAYHDRKRRRVFVEYVMLAGVNDGYAQAVALADVLGVQGGARRARPDGDREAHPRSRHRRGVRPAGGARVACGARPRARDGARRRSERPTLAVTKRAWARRPSPRPTRSISTRARALGESG